MLTDRKAEIQRGLIQIQDYKIVPIWHNPEVTEIGPEQLRLNFIQGGQRVYEEDVQVAIRRARELTLSKQGGWDGTLLAYRAHRWGGQLVLDVATTKYSEFVGTHFGMGQELWESKRRNQLSDGIVLTSIVETSDNKLPIGKRSYEISIGGGQDGLFGGTLNIDEEISFKTEGLQEGEVVFQFINHELSTELGVPLNVIQSNSNTRLKWFVRDGTFFRPNIFFLTKLNLTEPQLLSFFEQFGNKAEHPKISFIPNTPEGIISYLGTTNSELITESAKTGLRLQLRRLEAAYEEN